MTAGDARAVRPIVGVDLECEGPSGIGQFQREAAEQRCLLDAGRSRGRELRRGWRGRLGCPSGERVARAAGRRQHGGDRGCGCREPTADRHGRPQAARAGVVVGVGRARDAPDRGRSECRGCLRGGSHPFAVLPDQL